MVFIKITFEPGSFGVGNDRSTNCATTAEQNSALKLRIFLLTFKLYLNAIKQGVIIVLPTYSSLESIL